MRELRRLGGARRILRSIVVDRFMMYRGKAEELYAPDWRKITSRALQTE